MKQNEEKTKIRVTTSEVKIRSQTPEQSGIRQMISVSEK
jgi:hypothetical protein